MCSGGGGEEGEEGGRAGTYSDMSKLVVEVLEGGVSARRLLDGGGHGVWRGGVVGR